MEGWEEAWKYRKDRIVDKMENICLIAKTPGSKVKCLNDLSLNKFKKYLSMLMIKGLKLI
jgi:hypothetical protein